MAAGRWRARLVLRVGYRRVQHRERRTRARGVGSCGAIIQASAVSSLGVVSLPAALFSAQIVTRREADIFRQGYSGGLKLNRTDWRALQWTGSDASETIQLELPFLPPKHWVRFEPQRTCFRRFAAPALLRPIVRMRLFVVLAAWAAKQVSNCLSVFRHWLVNAPVLFWTNSKVEVVIWHWYGWWLYREAILKGAGNSSLP